MVRTSITIAGKRLIDHDFSHVNISQGIGTHHHFEVRLRQDAANGVLPAKAKAWIGQPIHIGFDAIGELLITSATLADNFKGVITSVALSRQSGTAELVLRGQSPTILADDGPNTQSFTEMTYQEIVSKVLNSYAFPTAPKVDPKMFTGSNPYVVQYRESGFAFVLRLANRTGEWFYYDGLDLFYGKPAGGNTITLDFGENGMVYFDMSVQAVPIKAKLSCYDYTTHEHFTEETPLKANTSALGKDVMKIATGQVYPGAPLLNDTTYRNQGGLKFMAKRREQVAVDEMVVIRGSTRNPGLKVGGKIEVKDTDLGENYGKFHIISLTHDIGQGGDYINHFEAIPEEVETPPATAISEAPFCEAQLAKVTKVDDENQLGRVKVKFPWQAGTSEETPWIRVASPYTGKDKGFYIIPEVDDQVLVAFENSNATKPYVLTGMYNGDAKPEWFDAKNKYKGFKSKGGNKWKFDDDAKAIQIHAPSSILMTAGKKFEVRTGKKGDDSSIVMEEGKSITVSTNKKGDSTILLDAGAGTVTIKAKKIVVEATDLIEMTSEKDIKANANSNVKISGTSKVEVSSVEIKISGTAKVETTGGMVDIKGSGVVNVQGALIKLN